MAQSSDKNAALLNATETVLLVGSMGTSVASVVFQQVTFAAITSVQLSLVVGLNSLNRKRLDSLNQRNENAIAQIQQQFLKEQKPIAQIEASIRQLPTYQDIATLQQQLEQLKIDHQKRLNQLNEDINTQEHQFNQMHIGLTVLRQKVDSISLINAEDLQNRIHEIRAYFEIKIRSKY